MKNNSRKLVPAKISTPKVVPFYKITTRNSPEYLHDFLSSIPVYINNTLKVKLLNASINILVMSLQCPCYC